MNDKERDRSSDGAGPVAVSKKKSCTRFRGIILLVLFVFFVSHITLYAQGRGEARLRGLSLTVDAGILKASNQQANFYNGNPNNANTLERILYSESYGHRIFNDLTEQDLIGSAIGTYEQINVAEYGDMYYKIAFKLGMGFRYDFVLSNWGWMARFDYAKLNAQGMVLLNSGKNLSYLTNQNAYVNCPVRGVEERIYIDLGILRKFKLSNGLDMELSLGGNFNNTKVEKSEIKIAGATYSILDVWQGQSPSSYIGTYEYVNQGGIGFGGYASLAIGFTLPNLTAMTLGYTFYYNKVNLEGYTAYAPHHAISLNVALNNFSFFDD